MIRRLRGRFGISAPRVSVRAHVPWYFRAASVVGALAFSLGLAVWAFDAGRRTAGFDQNETGQIVGRLEADNRSLEEEVARISSLLAASEGNLQIEQAAQKLLAEKYNLLAGENAKLQEDLAVFKRLSTLEESATDEVALDQLSIHREADGQYRYSFLIALQGKQRGKERKFDLQVVALPALGNTNVIVFQRTGASTAGQFEITLRNLRRIDGKFQVPKNYNLRAVEVKILDKGKLKASKQVVMTGVANVQ